MVVFGRQLVDAVDIDGNCRMAFVDRQPLRTPVDLAGGGIEHPCLRRVLAAGLDQIERRRTVALQVKLGLAHAVGVAYVAGQVEDVVLSPHQVFQRLGVAHIDDMDVRLVPDRGDVLPIAAALGQQGVDDADFRPIFHQPDGQIAAKEPQAASDQHIAATVVVGKECFTAFRRRADGASWFSGDGIDRAPPGKSHSTHQQRILCAEDWVD